MQPSCFSRFSFTPVALLLTCCVAVSTGGCGNSRSSEDTRGERQSKQEKTAAKTARNAARSTLPKNLPRGLLIALAQFSGGGTKPKAARIELLRRQGGTWRREAIEDPNSNVFHKAMPYAPKAARSGILTLGAMDAAVKLWTPSPQGMQPQTLWEASFGGKFNRMRDAEIANLDDDPEEEIVVGTHDQGVIAILDPSAKDDQYRIREIDRQANTFIHEIEIGDLNGDGKAEIYATPSEPNRATGGAQHGQVVRYDAANNFRREVVADLGQRHAKEILVADVDGDRRDELYVVVEALTETKEGKVRVVEAVDIRRYDADTAADQGQRIAHLDDRQCRFLTVGDIDGDGKREMVAAGFRSGLWLLKPSSKPRQPWIQTSIDRKSGGFEHAAVFADLDLDGRDELYVASDDHREIRRYAWQGKHIDRQVIHRRKAKEKVITWNLIPFAVDTLGKKQKAH